MIDNPLHLRPAAWAVTDASGHMSLHREETLANNYLSHVRGGVIEPLVRLSEVCALVESLLDGEP